MVEKSDQGFVFEIPDSLPVSDGEENEFDFEAEELDDEEEDDDEADDDDEEEDEENIPQTVPDF